MPTGKITACRKNKQNYIWTRKTELGNEEQDEVSMEENIPGEINVKKYQRDQVSWPWGK